MFSSVHPSELTDRLYDVGASASFSPNLSPPSFLGAAHLACPPFIARPGPYSLTSLPSRLPSRLLSWLLRASEVTPHYATIHGPPLLRNSVIPQRCAWAMAANLTAMPQACPTEQTPKPLPAFARQTSTY